MGTLLRPSMFPSALHRADDLLLRRQQADLSSLPRATTPKVTSSKTQSSTKRARTLSGPPTRKPRRASRVLVGSPVSESHPTLELSSSPGHEMLFAVRGIRLQLRVGVRLGRHGRPTPDCCGV